MTQARSNRRRGQPRSMISGYAPVLVLFGIALGGGIYWARSQPRGPSAVQVSRSVRGCEQVRDAFRRRQSGLWVSVAARTERVLTDSTGRFIHQRFIVRCGGGQTVLVVNDVSTGQRVPVTAGTRVTVRGQYVWNAEGGLIHFTHHDPEGGRGGWILFRGKVYAEVRRSLALT
jgi:hypothetical protein